MTDNSETGNVLVALETSISGGSLSLFQAGAAIDSWEGSEGISRSEDMPGVLRELLERNQIDKGRIEMIATAVGLGSFTGTRIGLATALGLKRAIGCRLVRVPLLLALAKGIETDGDVLAAVPVNKREVGWQVFSDAADEGPAQISIFSEFLDAFESFSKRQSASILSQNLFESVGRTAPDLIGENVRSGGLNLARYVGEYAFGVGDSESDPVLYSSGLRQNRL